MSVRFETSLRGVINTLQERIMPTMDDAFGREGARLSTLILTIVANGIDDAVAIRVAENNRIRSLLDEAAEIVSTPGLSEAAAGNDSDLRISALDTENDRLRRLLIAVHGAAEDLDSDAARDLCKRIWRALSDFTEARAPRRQA